MSCEEGGGNVAANSQPAAAEGIQGAGTIHSQPAEPEAEPPAVAVFEPATAAADPQPKWWKSKVKCKPKGQSQPIDYGTLIDINAANFHSQPLTRSKCKRGGGISVSPVAAKKMKNVRFVYKGSTSRKLSADEHQSKTPMNHAELAIYWSNLVEAGTIAIAGTIFEHIFEHIVCNGRN
ncbi:hypothetical protein RIF29_15629 [Crotalaria pallida]|uniref:Uncharacterized protein n=1 Tax=Crotalaria pallida TaxID=3830 RepID=A0AAN9FF57_CROPI